MSSKDEKSPSESSNMSQSAEEPDDHSANPVFKYAVTSSAPEIPTIVIPSNLLYKKKLDGSRSLPASPFRGPSSQPSDAASSAPYSRATSDSKLQGTLESVPSSSVGGMQYLKPPSGAASSTSGSLQYSYSSGTDSLLRNMRQAHSGDSMASSWTPPWSEETSERTGGDIAIAPLVRPVSEGMKLDEVPKPTIPERSQSYPQRDEDAVGPFPPLKEGGHLKKDKKKEK